MRRIALWLASTVTVVVLLLGYHTSTDKTSAPTPAVGASPPATEAPSASPTPSSSPSPKISKAKTYTGSVAQTRWGPVQLEITVTDGKINKVTVLQQPNGNPRDTEINEQALPILIKDTISAQSADIDMVSGATVTSEGYLQSLQAALDEAGI
ncbi:FMN-binding protein [uncultured Friedmanniella sp.]|uniref:FMN-binding protein n=1 Tax=uncultured Friedmanniella sp. TaxID=335381 RepID=UPI0035CB11F1